MDVTLGDQVPFGVSRAVKGDASLLQEEAQIEQGFWEGYSQLCLSLSVTVPKSSAKTRSEP